MYAGGKTVMVRAVQCQHEDLRQRLAWDPGITGLGISLTDRGEWTIAGESYSNFPLIFSVREERIACGCLTEVLHHLGQTSTCAVDGSCVDLGRYLEDGLIPR
jgi:hypothetical protein